jgi:uncharacterized protein (TIGR02147 family)
MKTIFEYIDYRKFLSSFYNTQKSSSRFFSYRYFAQKAKLHSPSFLKHVIDGKRNLTRPMIENFCIGLGLTEKEAVYFRNLVLFNQAKTSIEKQEYYSNLRSMSGGVKESVLNADQFDFFSNWYTPVIRELICQFDFKDDIKKIAAMLLPPILPSEVKAAIKVLLRLKLVRRQDDGTYFQCDSAIVADSEVASMAMRSFSKAMIEHSKNAVEAIGWQQRHISGITIGISPETYDVLSAEIEAFKDRVKLIVNRDTESCLVYQMNLSLFPLSRSVRTLNSEKAEET